MVRRGEGLRESATSWPELLPDLKARGLGRGHMLAVGDGAVGSEVALDQTYPETRPQRW